MIEPTRRIVEAVRQRYPDVPVIGFPRGIGARYPAYFKETGVTALSIDASVPPERAAKTLQPLGAVQGNLDPRILVTGGEALRSATDDDSRGAWPWTVHVQSRPWRHPGDAARSCCRSRRVDSGRMSKIAVVLMNLGGPDSAAAVEPFLFNLFYDRAIIALPNPLRWLVAKLIAHRRGPVAREIYAKIGNASPLLPNTEAQASALQQSLGPDRRVFIAMRYWQPRAPEAVAAVKEWGPDEVVLLPLYPQFSSTTTASSFADWHDAAAAAGLVRPTHSVCCYPSESRADCRARQFDAAGAGGMAGKPGAAANAAVGSRAAQTHRRARRSLSGADRGNGGGSAASHRPP